MVDEQNEFLRDVCQLITRAQNMGFQVTGGELFRTAEQQAIYVQKGLSKTQNSNHLRRLAVDLNFFIDGKLVQSKQEIQPLGDFWQSLNPKNRWGGNFTTILDTPHFERNV